MTTPGELPLRAHHCAVQGFGYDYGYGASAVVIRFVVARVWLWCICCCDQLPMTKPWAQSLEQHLLEFSSNISTILGSICCACDQAFSVFAHAPHHACSMCDISCVWCQPFHVVL